MGRGSRLTATLDHTAWEGRGAEPRRKIEPSCSQSLRRSTTGSGGRTALQPSNTNWALECHVADGSLSDVQSVARTRQRTRTSWGILNGFSSDQLSQSCASCCASACVLLPFASLSSYERCTSSQRASPTGCSHSLRTTGGSSPCAPHPRACPRCLATAQAARAAPPRARGG